MHIVPQALVIVNIYKYVHNVFIALRRIEFIHSCEVQTPTQQLELEKKKKTKKTQVERVKVRAGVPAPAAPGIQPSCSAA